MTRISAGAGVRAGCELFNEKLRGYLVGFGAAAKHCTFHLMSTSTWTKGRSWDLGEKVTGLQAASDAYRLYVGLRDGIAVLDTETGARAGTLRPNDIGRIEQLGESTRTLEEERTVVSCAC